MAVENLASRLEMTHLQDTADIVSEVEAAVTGKRAEPPTSKASREYPFDFKWESPTGKSYTGKFVSKILTIGEQGMVGILRARLVANVPYEALDDFTKELVFLVATLTYALKERPTWAEDLRNLDELELLQALYAEVASHEATFRGQRKTEAGGKEVG